MIEVRNYINAQGNEVLNIKGHSDIVTNGENIHCSSVSTMLICLYNLIDRADEEKNFKVELESGYFNIEYDLFKVANSTILTFIRIVIDILQDEQFKKVVDFKGDSDNE